MSDDNWYDNDDQSEDLDQDDDYEEQDTQDGDEFHHRRGGTERVELEFKIINKKSLLSEQLQDLRKVGDVLGVRTQHARTLLIHHRWDVESLFGKLADVGEDELFALAGLPPRDKEVEHSVPSGFMCRICYSDVEADEATMMDCGHGFCNDCKLRLRYSREQLAVLTQANVQWEREQLCSHDLREYSKAIFFEHTKNTEYKICTKHFAAPDNDVLETGWAQYLLMKIKEGQSRQLTCMHEKCHAICNEDKVRQLVSPVDSRAAERFEQSLLESYIEDNSKVKWCPSVPHCGNAICVEGDPFCELQCTCTEQFCFNCLEKPHSPCSCLMWRLWDKKCKDESETVNWMKAHTKPCPKCGKPVEKNGGCNLVACICGQAFCWLCGVATGRDHTWTNISGHSCGRYKEDVEKEAQRAEVDLKRYMHYHTRWMGHMESLQHEAKKRDETAAQIAKLEASDSLVKDYAWLTNGLHKLFRARRALSYSYAFAYYMFGHNIFRDDISETQNAINRHLFEDQQQQLEITVEKLSKYVEPNFDMAHDSEVQAVRMEVINLTALVDTLCRRMYEVIENDLLGSLELTTHHIAPYKSQGYDCAAEPSVAAPREPREPRDGSEAGTDAAEWGGSEEAPAERGVKRAAADSVKVDGHSGQREEAGEGSQHRHDTPSLPHSCGDRQGGGEGDNSNTKRRLNIDLNAVEVEGDQGGLNAALTRLGGDWSEDPAADGYDAKGQEVVEACPVCCIGFGVGVSNEEMNEHIDACLDLNA